MWFENFSRFALEHYSCDLSIISEMNGSCSNTTYTRNFWDWQFTIVIFIFWRIENSRTCSRISVIWKKWGEQWYGTTYNHEKSCSLRCFSFFFLFLFYDVDDCHDFVHRWTTRNNSCAFLDAVRCIVRSSFFIASWSLIVIIIILINHHHPLVSSVSLHEYILQYSKYRQPRRQRVRNYIVSSIVLLSSLNQSWYPSWIDLYLLIIHRTCSGQCNIKFLRQK